MLLINFFFLFNAIVFYFFPLSLLHIILVYTMGIDNKLTLLLELLINDPFLLLKIIHLPGHNGEWHWAFILLHHVVLGRHIESCAPSFEFLRFWLLLLLLLRLKKTFFLKEHLLYSLLFFNLCLSERLGCWNSSFENGLFSLLFFPCLLHSFHLLLFV